MKKNIPNIFSNMLFRISNVDTTNIKAISSDDIPYKVEVIAKNLFIPWAMDISSDGRIFFTERPGRIRVIENGKLLKDPLIKFPNPFISQSEGGLLGIALDPNFTQNHYIYAMYSYAEGNRIYNRVVRLIENNNKASINGIILDKIPGALIHNGGRLKIGPDQKLYITTGDAANPGLAQNPASAAGKILRVDLDGRIPKDNPIPRSPVYSLGHRNAQGLAWNTNNIMYESEHGQSAHDEINIIQPGANYGWPIVQGDEISKEIKTQKPLIQSGSETWAPSGITFITSGPWKGKLLVTNLRGEQLLLISLDEKGTSVKNVESLFKNEYGRLRDVIQGKDGSIYLTTSNRDGRGNPIADDDRIIRLSPK